MGIETALSLVGTTAVGLFNYAAGYAVQPSPAGNLAHLKVNDLENIDSRILADARDGTRPRTPELTAEQRDFVKNIRQSQQEAKRARRQVQPQPEVIRARRQVQDTSTATPTANLTATATPTPTPTAPPPQYPTRNGVKVQCANGAERELMYSQPFRAGDGNWNFDYCIVRADNSFRGTGVIYWRNQCPQDPTWNGTGTPPSWKPHGNTGGGFGTDPFYAFHADCREAAAECRNYAAYLKTLNMTMPAAADPCAVPIVTTSVARSTATPTPTPSLATSSQNQTPTPNVSTPTPTPYIDDEGTTWYDASESKTDEVNIPLIGGATAGAAGFVALAAAGTAVAVVVNQACRKKEVDGTPEQERPAPGASEPVELQAVNPL